MTAQRPRRVFGPQLHPVIRLGALVLILASCLLAGRAALAILLVLALTALRLSGLDTRSQLLSLKPWLPMGALIVLIHTFTTTAAAPLGTPTLAGVLAGLTALLRVSCTVSWLGLYIRTSSLDELVQAVRWWLRPLARLGFPVNDLGLMLAVALGTVPVVLSEGRRITTSMRLRRTGPAAAAGNSGPGRLASWVTGLLDKARVTVPLVEALGRRAEALSLSLRSRRPGSSAAMVVQPPRAGLVILLVWLVLLVLLATRWEGLL